MLCLEVNRMCIHNRLCIQNSYKPIGFDDDQNPNSIQKTNFHAISLPVSQYASKFDRIELTFRLFSDEFPLNLLKLRVNQLIKIYTCTVYVMPKLHFIRSYYFRWGGFPKV